MRADCMIRVTGRKYHVAHYGHPSKFGFKDIIPLWKAERRDPDRLMGLYQKAGARYFCMIAEHHDNFDCWNSKYQPWNSVNMGPKRDIAGEWQKAARKHGLRFGMTEHLVASWWFYGMAKGADKTGPLAGVPYDGADPALPHCIGPTTCGPRDITTHRAGRRAAGVVPPHPGHDRSLPPGPALQRQSAALSGNLRPQAAGPLLQRQRQQHRGRLEAVYNCKENSHGRWVQDLERGVMDKICPVPWQTDTCVGGGTTT